LTLVSYGLCFPLLQVSWFSIVILSRIKTSQEYFSILLRFHDLNLPLKSVNIITS
jgi:hypothetical protein